MLDTLRESVLQYRLVHSDRHSIEKGETEMAGRDSDSDVRKLGRHGWDSMCGGFGCLYLMKSDEIFVITDNGTKRSLSKHRADEWGACSLGPILRRGDDFILVRDTGAEVHLRTEKCSYWQGGEGCLYFFGIYGDITLFPITV